MSNPTKDLQYQRSLHWFFTGNTCTTNFFLNEKVLPWKPISIQLNMVPNLHSPFE